MAKKKLIINSDNIKSKNVTQTAEYILGGSGFDEDEEYWDEEE